MRRILIAFLLVLALLFGGVCYAGASVYRERDRIRFTETALYGDPAMVEGVTVEYSVENDAKLFWDIRYTAGNPEAEADYAYHPFGQPVYGSFTPNGVVLNVETHSGLDFMEKAPEELTGLEPAFRALYEAAPPGEEVRQIIRLGDYYTYYPIEAMHDLPGVSRIRESLEEAEEENQYFEDFFRIPVLPDEMLEIHVEKHPDGRGHSFGSGTVQTGDRFYFDTCSAIGKDDCYFTFRLRSHNGVILDTSHIPGGYGIYRLPFGEEKIFPERLETVYPLDPNVRVDGLTLTPDESALLLFTMEEGVNVLTVIDLATMETRQRMEILKTDADDGDHPELYDVYQGEGFLMLRYGGGHLALLSRDVTGEYALKFVTDIGNDTLPDHYPTVADQGADWNGERLILCSRMYQHRQYEGKNLAASFVLSVYDQTGLLYAGEYECSLDTGWDQENWEYDCRFLESIPYRVRWPV